MLGNRPFLTVWPVKAAIINDTPASRDWREADATLMGHKVTIIDTAELEEHFDDSIQGRMRVKQNKPLTRVTLPFL